MSAITHVHILAAPGLYEVSSSSATRYYVDTRDPDLPLYMRWRGESPLTPASHMDNAWHPLLRLTSLPLEILGGIYITPHTMDPHDIVDWTLRVGHGHEFETRRDANHPNGPVYWVAGRAAESITLLDEMPPEEERAGKDQWLP